MAFEGREVEFPMRFKLVPATDSDGSTIANTYDLERVEGTVTTEGTPLTADNLNTEIAEAAETAAESAVAAATASITTDASGNVKVRNFKAGAITMKTTKAKQTVHKHVSFSGQAFSARPAVTLTPLTGAPSAVAVSAANVTTTGFDLYFYRTSASTNTVFWQAALPTQ